MKKKLNLFKKLICCGGFSRLVVVLRLLLHLWIPVLLVPLPLHRPGDGALQVGAGGVVKVRVDLGLEK